MIPLMLQHLVRLTRAKEARFSETGLYHLYLAFGGSHSLLGLAGPCFGAPHAVLALEKLIALGAERIWALGWCGSLQPSLPIGHVVIPAGAVPEEGTSPHYPTGQEGPTSDKAMNEVMEREILKAGLPYSIGHVWTTDALYRETRHKVKAFQARGVLGVEMEMSALMAVATYRSVRLAGLLVISDELFDLTWRPGFSMPELTDSSRRAAQVLLDSVRSFKTVQPSSMEQGYGRRNDDGFWI